MDSVVVGWKSTYADSITETASTAFRPATIRETGRRREPGTRNAAGPEGGQEFNKTKDLFEISNQLRYAELLAFPFQDEQKVRMASTASIVCLVFPCHL
jgi:hypothetical protein